VIDHAKTAFSSVFERQHFIVRKMGLSDYQVTWQAMKDFTSARTAQTCDEIWLLQHPAVFTQGIAGKPEHLLYNTGIDLIKTISKTDKLFKLFHTIDFNKETENLALEELKLKFDSFLFFFLLKCK